MFLMGCKLWNDGDAQNKYDNSEKMEDKFKLNFFFSCLFGFSLVYSNLGFLVGLLGMNVPVVNNLQFSL
jgi:hypothetical protein